MYKSNAIFLRCSAKDNWSIEIYKRLPQSNPCFSVALQRKINSILVDGVGRKPNLYQCLASEKKLSLAKRNNSKVFAVDFRLWHRFVDSLFPIWLRLCGLCTIDPFPIPLTNWIHELLSRLSIRNQPPTRDNKCFFQINTPVCFNSSARDTSLPPPQLTYTQKILYIKK